MGAWLLVPGAEEILAVKTGGHRFRSGLWVLGPRNEGDVANLDDIKEYILLNDYLTTDIGEYQRDHEVLKGNKMPVLE